MLRVVFVFWAILLGSGSAHAQQEGSPNRNGCKERYKIVEECAVFRGRLGLTASSGIRVWLIGTKRMPRAHDGPEWLAKIIDKDTNALVFADFEICPMEKYRPGLMQEVCIESASRVTVLPQEKADEYWESVIPIWAKRDPYWARVLEKRKLEQKAD